MKELPLSKAYQFIEPGPVLFLVTSDKGKPNLMSMSAHIVIEDDERPLIGCALGPWDFSFGILCKTRECVLAVPTADLATEIVQIGNCSGAETDKFTVFGLTPEPAKIVNAPLVAECLVNLECRLVDQIERYNLAILEVVHSWIDPTHKDQRMLHHNGNGTFRVDGETLDLRDKMVKWPSYVGRWRGYDWIGSDWRSLVVKKHAGVNSRRARRRRSSSSGSRPGPPSDRTTPRHSCGRAD